MREETLEDLGENGPHACLGELRHPNHVEVSEKTGGYGVPTSSWRSASTHEASVFDLFEDKFLGVVETRRVNSLPQKLARRLGAIAIELGHVYIVDEEDHLLTSGWSQEGLSLGLKVALESVLEVLGGGLSREVYARVYDVLGRFVEEILHNDGLADSSLTGDEDVIAVVHKGIQ